MGKIRVALVEDDKLTQLALKIALQERGDIDWVGEATDGTQGLTLLKTLQPDVAIVDIGLPDLDGIELTKQFKNSRWGQQENATKILIFTMHDNEEQVLAAFAAGADSYCMKDTRLELLLEALKVTQEGHAWIDPAIARIVLSHTQKSVPFKLNPIHPADPQYHELLETYPLTDRELDVLRLIVDGYSNGEIAERLFITIGTVKTHVRSILNKLSASDRTQAAVRALRSGLVG